MRKLILFVGLIALQQITYGQCDQKAILKSKNARHLQHGAIKGELPMDASISMDKERIVLTASAEGETETVNFEIKEVVICDWKEFLKNGKAQYKGLGKKGDETPEDGIVSIVSENGYTKVTIEGDPKGNSLEFDIDSYTITEDPLPASVPVKTEQKQKKTKKKAKTNAK